MKYNENNLVVTSTITQLFTFKKIYPDIQNANQLIKLRK